MRSSANGDVDEYGEHRARVELAGSSLISTYKSVHAFAHVNVTFGNSETIRTDGNIDRTHALGLSKPQLGQWDSEIIGP